MSISDVVEKTKEIVNDNKDICDSYDKTKKNNSQIARSAIIFDWVYHF